MPYAIRRRPTDEFVMGATEIMGFDEILGEEMSVYGYDDEMVGASRRPARATIRKSAPTSARDLYLGLTQAGFTASATTQNVTATPQVTFRPDRFVVGDSIAASFQLNSLFIGNRLQSVANSAVGCETFSNKSVGVRLKLDTAVIGLQVVASITYLGTNTASQTFSGTLIGPAVY